MTELLIVRRTWWILLAAMVGLFPFTVYSTFLVPIAESVGTSTATAGTLRGLGGVSALLVGVGMAPWLRRWAPRRTGGVALLVLAVGSVSATATTVTALMVFCLTIGLATALLTPTVLTLAAEAFSQEHLAGRAATLVTAVQTLTAVLAAPVVATMVWWVGWTGALWLIAMLATVLAVGFLLSSPESAAEPVVVGGYRQVFGAFRRRPDLVRLVLIAALRTASFMGYLSFLAVLYDQRHEMSPAAFTMVWTVSGASFVLGNVLAGRWGNADDTLGRRQRLLLRTGLVIGLVAVLVVFWTDSLSLALTATVAMGLSHAVVAAQVTTVIVRSAGDLRAPVLSLNAAGMSLGVFVGASLGGVGLAIGGLRGLGVALAVPVVLALVLSWGQVVRDHSPRDALWQGQPQP